MKCPAHPATCEMFCREVPPPPDPAPGPGPGPGRGPPPVSSAEDYLELGEELAAAYADSVCSATKVGGLSSCVDYINAENKRRMK